MKKILQKNHPILRQKAKEVALKDITSAKIKKIIREMTEALSQEPEGVALAAPQLGYSLRIFVVANHKLKNKQETAESEQKEESFFAYLNPKIIKTSRKKHLLKEGCLSLTGVYQEVWRKEKLTVEAYDENGKKFRRGASETLAEVIQHEIDHLNGVLFIDNASEIKKS